VYYKCVKFHKNPISGLGGVALTRYMDGRTVAEILLKVALNTINLNPYGMVLNVLVSSKKSNKHQILIGLFLTGILILT
jgi:hypothetical protein